MLISLTQRWAPRGEMTYGDVNADAPPPPVEHDTFAVPADDDSRWRQQATHDPSNTEQRRTHLLSQCEARVAAAVQREGPRTLLDEITKNDCTAIKKGGRDCAKCRMCPNEEAWAQVGGYYRATKGKVFVCAEKEPSQQRVEEILTHELVHAYDHCRYSMRVPFVGRQAPYALTCAATACSEVRAYLLAGFRRASAAAPPAALVSPFGDGSGGPSSEFSSQPEPLADGAASAEADRSRERVYLSALTSASAYGMCADQARDTATVLDAVFNACMADSAPFGGRGSGRPGGGGPFPEMPPEVEAAEKAPAVPAVPRAPPLERPTQPEAKWGET